MRKHDAWLVDLDGTLYQPKPLKLVMAAHMAVSGPRAIRIIRQFRKEHEAIRAAMLGCDPSPFEEQLLRTARALAVERDEVLVTVNRFMFERPLPWLRRLKRNDLLREIASFREDGGRTAIVSDYPASAKLAALEVTTLFDRIVASGEPDGPTRLKPAPDGFLLAAKALGVEPSRCLVIGDRLDADGDAARAAGMEFRLIR
ncbi:MAG TPA: HAD-IA family hydrolase [Polyangiaceae bacterium]